MCHNELHEVHYSELSEQITQSSLHFLVSIVVSIQIYIHLLLSSIVGDIIIDFIYLVKNTIFWISEHSFFYIVDEREQSVFGIKRNVEFERNVE